MLHSIARTSSLLALALLTLPAAADSLLLSPNTPLDVSALGVSSVGDLAYDPASGKLWLCDGSTDGLVHKVNPITGALMATVDPAAIPGLNLGPDALAVLPSGSDRTVFVFSSFGESEGGSLHEAGGLLADFGTSRSATGAAIDLAGNLWIVSGTTAGAGSQLQRLDSTTGAVLASVPILGTTLRMVDLAFDPHTGACYVLTESTHQLIEVNTTTGAQLSSTDLSTFLPSGGGPTGGIAFDTNGQTFYVAGAGLATDTVLVFHRTFGYIACDGSGVFAPCPCGNQGIAGSGCAHSASTNGAALLEFGLPEVGSDSFQILATNVPATTSVLFFQGTTLTESTPLALGDGLICVSGSIIRLATKSASGGSAVYPASGDVPLHTRGAIPAGGATRYYQAWYRNAASFCTASTFNFTSALQVRWAP